ncbi:hypothetical protein ACFYSF_22175 [Streptomyces canus]|uniref:hypothetical protein n=1 Tax=Streptomyces canus TaxID=58343 RepID=UPI0036B587FA
MRPYSRPNRAQYPSATRALNQVERALRVLTCPQCGHPVRVHAIEGGHRVCTRGYGVISCRDCAHNYAALSRFGQLAMEGFLSGMRQARRYVPQGLEFGRPVVLDSPETGGMFGSSTS